MSKHSNNGNVRGPTSAVDNTLVRFDGTTGRLIKSSTTINIATEVTGVLPIANGGTNSSTALNNNRVMKSAGGAIVEAAAITANRALISDANGIPTQSATTNTELGYVNGVTSAIQTQLDSKLNLSGGTMTGALLLNADPSAALGAATKQYVDAVAQGLSIKASALVATTANITLSGEQTIDGILTSSSRVLVKNQSTASQNGIYVSAAGSWTRSTDADTGSELESCFVFVEEGSTNSDTGWVQTTNPPITLGSTSIVFAQFSGAGAYTADGQGVKLSGNQFSFSIDGTTLSQSASGAKVASGGITNTEINASAGIVDTKLATIATAGKVSNSATTATAANTASTIVLRDGSNNFSAGTITAALTGTASGNTTYTANNHGIVVSGSANAMTVVAPDASTTKFLKSGGSGADPTWSAVTLTSGVTGTLPVANGGTGSTTYTAGSVIFAGSGGTTLTQDNTNLFFDDTNNRLGIGTAAPSVPLHVVGSGTAVVPTAGTFLEVQASSSGIVPAYISVLSGATGASGMYLGNVGGSGLTLGGITYDSNVSKLYLRSNDIQALAIDSTGKVGIGNTSPGALLDVGLAGTTLGTVRLEGSTSGYVDLVPTVAAGSVTITLPAATGTVALTSNKLSAFASTTSAELAGVISDETGSGALVFGTSPVFTTGLTSPLIIGGTGTTSTLTLKTTTGVGTTNADMIFQVGNNGATEAMRILNSGNVGIKNNAPGALLDVGTAGTTLGTMRLEGNTSGYVQIQPPAAAGSWTMTLPNSGGTNGYVLTTNGSGVTSWAAAAGGGGAPTHVTGWHDEDAILAGTSSFTANIPGGTRAFPEFYQNPAANGDSFQQTCFIAAGTYTFYVKGETSSDRGLMDWYLNGSTFTTGQDWYGSTVPNTVKTASITISSSGVQTIKGTVNGKNISSGNYYMSLSKWWIA